MNSIGLALDIYKKVVFENVPFSLAIKNEWKNKNVEAPQRNEVSALVGCALRHYLIFEYRISELKIDFSNKEKLCIMLVLANNLFIKKFDNSDILGFINENFSSSDKQEAALNLIQSLNDPNLLIPDSIDRNSKEYLSLRYNTPTWIVKMLQKHYGYKFAYKTLRANSKPSINSCRVNSSIISKDDFNFNLVDEFGNNIMMRLLKNKI